MRESSVDEMHPVDARIQGVDRTVYLGKHTFRYHPFLLEGFDLMHRETGEQGGRVLGVSEKTWDVR